MSEGRQHRYWRSMLTPTLFDFFVAVFMLAMYRLYIVQTWNNLPFSVNEYGTKSDLNTLWSAISFEIQNYERKPPSIFQQISFPALENVRHLGRFPPDLSVTEYNKRTRDAGLPYEDWVELSWLKLRTSGLKSDDARQSDIVSDYRRLQEYGWAPFMVLTVVAEHPEACFLPIVTWDSTTNVVGAHRTLHSSFQNCMQRPQTQIIFAPLVLNAADRAHAQMIIINKTNRTLERFDPNGVTRYDVTGDPFKQIHLDTYLTKLSKQFKLTRVVQTGPPIQLIESLSGSSIGLCEAWVYWYLETRLLNLHIPTDVLNAEIVRYTQLMGMDGIIGYLNYRLTMMKTIIAKLQVNSLQSYGSTWHFKTFGSKVLSPRSSYEDIEMEVLDFDKERHQYWSQVENLDLNRNSFMYFIERNAKLQLSSGGRRRKRSVKKKRQSSRRRFKK